MTPMLLAGGLAVTVTLVFVLGWRAELPAWNRIDRLGALVLLAALFTMSLLVVTLIVGMVRFDWNAARLTPTFALVYGYQLYYPATEGPILSTVYGPVSAFAFLPATVFRTPTPAILSAGVLEVLYVFGPMLAFVYRASGRGVGARPLVLACGIGACLLLARYPGTSYWIWAVEPDGPALGLGLLACLALVSPDGTPPPTRNLVLSATSVVLACWAKQIDGPLALALLLVVWLAYGRRPALTYALALAAVGTITSVLFLAWFGKPMIFNMVQIVARQPWYKPGLAGLASQVWALFGFIWDLLVLLVVALAGALLVRGRRTPIVARPWMAPLLAAVLLLPAGALGANKLGADHNSFHSVYYLIAAVAAALVDWGQSARAGRVLCYAFCAAAILAAWRSDRIALWASHPPLWQNDPQLAYDFAVRHPGEAYFPWHPLASLLAEGGLYHFDYAMIDRFFGGYEPTPAHVRANLPPRMRWIAAKGGRVWTLNHYFAEYSQEVNLPELPGWTVFARPSP